MDVFKNYTSEGVILSDMSLHILITEPTWLSQIPQQGIESTVIFF